MTIIDFINDRLSETERVAREATPGPWEAFAYDSGHSQFEMSVSVITSEMGDTIADLDGLMRLRNERDAKDDGCHDAAHIALNDPAHVLAWVTALRAVVEHHADGGPDDICAADFPCFTIRAIAAIWAQHPDFESEWA